MNAALPGWMAATANATVVHWVYEPKDDAKTFYVYPPQPVTGMGYVEMRYAAVPAAIALGAVIPIDDNHENAIMLFMLHRAWLKKQPVLAGGSSYVHDGSRAQRGAEEGGRPPTSGLKRRYR
jgi:hypothetical protein